MKATKYLNNWSSYYLKLKLKKMLPQIVLHSIHKLDLPDSAAIFMRKNNLHQ